ncbi:DNA-processing protein DprA [Patescibacteria group bacterium]|nr:DNA-processing protein DprA [Patescibacteria group bacterium]MBU4511879.1 DNA-processing protein DprA [Patescibacteria group bacterium]
MNNDLLYWNAIANIKKIGPSRFKRLSNYFENMETAFNASFDDLIRAGIEENIAQEFIVSRNEIDPEAEWEKLEKEHINIVTVKDKNYPKLLKEIYNPPALLYYKGKLEENEDFLIAVVGTRKITEYGKQVTPDIVEELAKNGITVVSGLALGVDALAHEITIKNSGRTIAVLGSGLDNQNIYPFHNRFLAEKIIANDGLVITEYPPGTLPLKQHFPHRNRIIAGLSLGVLVIEAAKESGALITAKYALDQNRDVFAVPGSIYNKTSQGPNNLIKMGAKPVTSGFDILDTLNLVHAASFIETKQIIPDTKEEGLLLDHLSKEPIHIDELVRESKLSTPEVTSTLTMMEMKGKVRNLGGMNYVLAR